jgi:prevent-host-death family protein
MREVGLFEAKTKLSALVEEAGRGAEITITKRGKPVARLMPPATHDAEAAKAAIERLRARRNERKPVTIEEIIAWKNEGRR